MLKKNIAIASLLLVSACSTATEPTELTERTLESRIDGNTTQLVLINADGEVVLDQGIANLVGNEGAADIKNFGDIQMSADQHYAFVSVAGYEGTMREIYDLETAQSIAKFSLANQSGFSQDGTTAFACASASGYGTYYVQTLDLETKKVNDILPMEGLNSEKAYSVECTTDEDSLNFTFTKDDEKEEYEYNYKEARLDKK